MKSLDELKNEIQNNDVYIPFCDMVIKPFWDENKSRYFDLITWNAAIEEAIQLCRVYDRGFSTDAGMIRLKLGELKK